MSSPTLLPKGSFSSHHISPGLGSELLKIYTLNFTPTRARLTYCLLQRLYYFRNVVIEIYHCFILLFTIHLLLFLYPRLWHKTCCLLNSKSASSVMMHNLFYSGPSVIWHPYLQCFSSLHLRHIHPIVIPLACHQNYPLLKPLIKYLVP